MEPGGSQFSQMGKTRLIFFAPPGPLIQDLNKNPYNNANISNVGLHIDIVAPLATNPWESLNPSERNALTQRFNNVFIELVEALDPDILISPVKLSTYFSTFNGTILSSKAVTFKKSGIRSVNKMLGNIGGRCRVVIEGWNGPTPFPFADKSVIYSAIH